MRLFDFSSWQSIGTTLLGLALFTLIGVGIRLMVMMTIQQRRERMNRQINERLRTLMAAYKVLGGSFTGDLTVDPRHLRDMRRAYPSRARPRRRSTCRAKTRAKSRETANRTGRGGSAMRSRRRCPTSSCSAPRIRCASPAAPRANWPTGGRCMSTTWSIALRDFIRQALDLDPVPDDVVIPLQGPTRPGGGGGKGGGGDRGQGGGGGGAVADGGGGMGVAGGLGVAGGATIARGSAGEAEGDTVNETQPK